MDHGGQVLIEQKISVASPILEVCQPYAEKMPLESTISCWYIPEGYIPEW